MKPIETIAQGIMDEIRRLLPGYLKVEADYKINDGNVAVCILDDTGKVYGEMFGDDRVKLRSTFKTAVSKATQVWLTGYETGKYEMLVYTNQVNWWEYGIPKPEFIGWDGGVPVKIDAEHTLAIGFSGFRGEMDRDIILKATEAVLK